jgi:hypothetical protein
MTPNNMRLTAMAPSGSSYVVQRENDESLWLVHPEGAGETEQITPNDLAVAMTFHDFILVEGAWESPLDVENRVDALCDPVELEDVETTVEDVRRFLGTLAEDATDSALAAAVMDETSAYFDVQDVLEDELLAVELRRIRSVAKHTLQLTLPKVSQTPQPIHLSAHRARWQELQPSHLVSTAARRP